MPGLQGQHFCLMSQSQEYGWRYSVQAVQQQPRHKTFCQRYVLGAAVVVTGTHTGLQALQSSTTYRGV
jgi:hypothetical protein